MAPAEKLTVEAETVDLVTTAQAVHWFDLQVYHLILLTIFRIMVINIFRHFTMKLIEF